MAEEIVTKTAQPTQEGTPKSKSISTLANMVATAQIGTTENAQFAQNTGQAGHVEQGNQNKAQSPANHALEAAKLELASIELESAKLKLELDKANLVDMRERLAERELKRENIRQEAYTKGSTIKATKDGEARQQAHCNHKKGGNGAAGVVGGQGDDSQYAVLKHTFANGDTWVRCLRCGKTWKPPVKSEHASQVTFDAALAIYKEALNFQTRNVPSKGVIFQFSDGGEFYRENTKQSTLR